MGRNDAVNRLLNQVSARWQAADPLLPRAGSWPVATGGLPWPAGSLPSSAGWMAAPDGWARSPAEAGPAGCGAQFSVSGAAGPTAVAVCTHWQVEAESLDQTWDAARRFELSTYIGGPDVTDVTDVTAVSGALDELLGQWRDHLSGLTSVTDPDSAALIHWPSRDVAGAGPLVRHGFAPLAVIASRPTPARPPSGLPSVPGVTIRRAGPADVGPVTELGLQVVRFDAHFGGVTERPSTAAALERELAGLLAAERPWVWLAERGGTAIGMLAAEPPDTASWIAPLSGPAPVCYLLLMGVWAGDRGTGVGAALAGRLHREVRAAGVRATLLHYAQVNPLSAPFWSQQGYRPLWHCWEARPAAAIR
jgi:GNAT superfamily N-acetyltransferase